MCIKSILKSFKILSTYVILRFKLKKKRNESCSLIRGNVGVNEIPV